MTTTIDVEIEQPVIELYKLLKLAGLAGSGGEAKALIADGQVSLDGQTETRKRKKVGHGETVSIGANAARVVFAKPTHNDAATTP